VAAIEWLPVPNGSVPSLPTSCISLAFPLVVQSLVIGGFHCCRQLVTIFSGFWAGNPPGGLVERFQPAPVREVATGSGPTLSIVLEDCFGLILRQAGERHPGRYADARCLATTPS
jgi:hypothetical protein